MAPTLKRPARRTLQVTALATNVADAWSRAFTVEGIREGLPVAVVGEAAAHLGLSQETLAALLGVSARTLQRRRGAGEPLTRTESDRLARLVAVHRLAARAFESDEAASAWLTTPHRLLGGETPFERIDTEPGLREVRNMLTVIDENGVA